MPAKLCFVPAQGCATPTPKWDTMAQKKQPHKTTRQRPSIALQSCQLQLGWVQPHLGKLSPHKKGSDSNAALGHRLWTCTSGSCRCPVHHRCSSLVKKQTALLLLPCSSILPHTHNQIFFSPLKSKYQDSSIPHHRVRWSYDDFLCGPGYIQKSHKPISGDSRYMSPDLVNSIF